MGLTSGLPGIGVFADTTEPQLEQNRALGGIPDPHR
jgi:hypothetical protein